MTSKRSTKPAIATPETPVAAPEAAPETKAKEAPAVTFTVKVGDIVLSKKGNYYYEVTNVVENIVTLKWVMPGHAKTAYSYSRPIKMYQIGKQYMPAELPAA
ncbi:MAG: hypothetical protein QUS07_07130 [Methanothrix sp.]|nr:hypothetical protein [Methanothrix sp.]